VRVGRFARRAALRAGLGAALGALVPKHRLAGALAGAAAGCAIEQPAAGIPLALAALATRDATGIAAGAALAALTTRVWPTAPRTVEELRRSNTAMTVEPCVDGAGVVIVLNLAAGSADADDLHACITERLPAAEVVDVGEDDDVGALLADAAARATVALGAAGGDGTLSAAAAVAHDRGLRLLALPAGTLNHFARDLGVLQVDDAIDALQAGQAVRVQLAAAGDRTFLNTASFGAYTDLVDARERLEDRIGKWPAVAVSLVGVLRRAEPLQVEIDGRPRSLWLGFIGNARYQPAGFGPTWRERLDDGVVDVRLVDAAQPWARTKLLLSVLTGQLGRSAVYAQSAVTELKLDGGGSDLRIALDGEVLDVDLPATITTREPALVVHAPHR
jgi:diacylglycerol kinase family enzyme